MDPQLALLVAKIGIEAVPKLIELFDRLGSRDAFLEALDAALLAARAKTDIDLAAKHAHDHADDGEED